MFVYLSRNIAKNVLDKRSDCVRANHRRLDKIIASENGVSIWNDRDSNSTSRTCAHCQMFSLLIAIFLGHLFSFSNRPLTHWVLRWYSFALHARIMKISELFALHKFIAQCILSTFVAPMFVRYYGQTVFDFPNIIRFNLLLYVYYIYRAFIQFFIIIFLLPLYISVLASFRFD